MMQNTFAQLTQERFGCDKLISLATCADKDMGHVLKDEHIV